MTMDRRSFLRYLGSSAFAATLQQSIERALAIPANNQTGTIRDVQHIVFLMQENRAFDHYFGTLRGVRGFSDPRPVSLPSGKPVWYQPDGNSYVLPFHPSAPNLGMQYLEDTPHGWTDQHKAWNNGKYDQWIAAKGTRSTMAYLKRADIPYHYALADAFTICDAYHCSLIGPTDPNRYHMWTGWVGNDGQGGGPVVDNAEEGYGWSTYPERLEKAGISWKIYQDSGVGLDGPGFWGWTSDPYIGNYGDNSLLYFHQYQNAVPGQPLYEKARRGTTISQGGTLFDILKNDVAQNQLPQVSWIVAPEAFTEHGNWPANFGAWYVSEVLNALTSNPLVWSKTVLFIMYDENDGFFDHIVPPTPPRSSAEGLSTVPVINEIFPGGHGYASGPYGLGYRVPMLVISPWSKGGWVCSQLFDHTSLIRFLEARFAVNNPGLFESNITPWRRAICGDLTSAFDFSTPNQVRPILPSTAAYVPPDHSRHADYVPAPPANQVLPVQENGLRLSRALPYELNASGKATLGGSVFSIGFSNTGDAGAHFQVRSGNSSAGPWAFTVEAGKSLFYDWALAQSQDHYDLSVYGPNGFYRGFKGNAAASTKANLDVDISYDVNTYLLHLVVRNNGPSTSRAIITSPYGSNAGSPPLAPGQSFTLSWGLNASFGWYDITVKADGDPGFLRHLAGHVENGRDSVSEPALGGLFRS